MEFLHDLNELLPSYACHPEIDAPACQTGASWQRRLALEMAESRSTLTHGQTIASGVGMTNAWLLTEVA